MSRSTLEFLQHIQQELAYLLGRSANMTYEDFINNDDLIRSFVRSLEVIGEASKNVPDAVRYENPEFDWSGFAKLRDRLIHQYWGIEYLIIWNAIQTELPSNKEWIDVIIEQESAKHYDE
jgi:uncharacterized protein with HEPN domain